MSASDMATQQQAMITAQPATTTTKPTIIGLYGISGSGKTTLLQQVRETLDTDNFSFFEGTDEIAKLVDGGIEAFKKMDEGVKSLYRQAAIKGVAKACVDSGKAGIVTGHYMLWGEGNAKGEVVCTKADLEIFTHILYLDRDPRTVFVQRKGDKSRARPEVSAQLLEEWQNREKNDLRKLCRAYGILFATVGHVAWNARMAEWFHDMWDARIEELLNDFCIHNETHNTKCTEQALDVIFPVWDNRKLDTVLVIDADGTLAAEDTGAIFWSKIAGKGRTLKTLFSGPLQYSYTACRQAMLLYEEAKDDEDFDTLCEEVAAEVTVHPEFVHLLTEVAKHKHVRAVIVTCGVRRIWKKVLKNSGLTVPVIGGGRISDGYVVTAGVKAGVVSKLQALGMQVVAFGDSPLDLPMLSQANRPIVVVGEEGVRSRSMDADLEKAIDGGLRAHQLLLPSTATPRDETYRLPLITLPTVESFVLDYNFTIVTATNKTAVQLLAGPTRDANIRGGELRQAHSRIGQYLATEYLANIIDVEPYNITAVQGMPSEGHILLHEQNTAIVSLMRGGDPLAAGVSEAFQLASYYHAKEPEDLTTKHLKKLSTVILADAVVNNGDTVAKFVRHIRKVHLTVSIVVVAAVVQAGAVAEGGSLVKALRGQGKVTLVCLRTSDTRYTGVGGTDTGHRLFNTTHLDGPDNDNKNEKMAAGGWGKVQQKEGDCA
ncbi:Uu.00g083920.m01.CDS01 [Anthostomella pinea]|uniref:Uu.00g083920.m01.CDS01 n=1 Tax=Anthostomella pinea TaxID=933095 RepID=A0AAI8VLM3_9PEZI|nr:Uu.00g083920.m01.CDS01 [Anthostomella pinea]